MGYKEQYEEKKKALVNDKKICKANRDLFKEFFEHEEYKLKRKNGIPHLDEGCYRTLLTYTTRFRNVNKWFKNKAWKDLTEKDIKKVYDDLEENKIKTKKGTPHKDKIGYYNKVFKSKPFDLAGKKEIAKKIMEFQSNGDKNEVRFVDEENFRRLVSVVAKPTHLLLLWLAYDIGENINSLLKLKKKHFVRQENKDTKEVEYLINFPKEALKRSRTARGELTNFQETVKYADMVLEKLEDDKYLFDFGYGQAFKLLQGAINRSGAKCVNGTKPTWKDLRSGMACYLLKHGWSTDEINSRLKHKPSSREIDKYVDYLAIDRNKPKKRLFNTHVEELEEELNKQKKITKHLLEKYNQSMEIIVTLGNEIHSIAKKIKS